MNKELIVFIDCGDTIIDESTQIFAENEDVLSAKPIEIADKVLHQLHDEGYRLVLVADGRVQSFYNILTGIGLNDLFEAQVISETLGVHKPHPLMFERALEAVGLDRSEAYKTVMIGNNLKRDVLGANEMGIISILLSFSPRYVMQPETEKEVPDYVIALPSELPALLDVLEKQIQNRRILRGKYIV